MTETPSVCCDQTQRLRGLGKDCLCRPRSSLARFHPIRRDSGPVSPAPTLYALSIAQQQDAPSIEYMLDRIGIVDAVDRKPQQCRCSATSGMGAVLYRAMRADISFQAWHGAMGREGPGRRFDPDQTGLDFLWCFGREGIRRRTKRPRQGATADDTGFCET